MKHGARTEPTHVAYADETHQNIGRYRGIGLISLGYKHAAPLGGRIRKILLDSRIKEFKWQKLNSESDRKAALKMLEFAIGEACSDILRVDVLTWDIEDSRHRVRGRDDEANLQRMYYHLFKKTLHSRWPDSSVWRLCPDEHGGIQWNELARFLKMAGTHAELQGNFLTNGGFCLTLKKDFRIEHIEPCQSHKEPLVQLADLFAGLGVYSRANYSHYESWHRVYGQSFQGSLFPADCFPLLTLSNRDRERCFVLAEFNASCKRKRLGVSLRKNQGLRTYNPRNPINFWWYQPQQGKDKAPIKE